MENVRDGSRERDGPTSSVFTVLGGCGNSEKRCGGDARERDGVRVCTETQRKEKGHRGGILGTWIDAVLSNHVLRFLLSVFHPVPPVSPLSPSSFLSAIESATRTCIVNVRMIVFIYFCVFLLSPLISMDSFLQGCPITYTFGRIVYADIFQFILSKLMRIFYFNYFFILPAILSLLIS